VDTVGVTLAGAADDAGTTVAASVGRTSASDGVRLIGHGERASETDAALVNGTAGHGLDFDDVSSGMQGHPSVTMVPALLAVGQAESVTGRDLLTAFIAGFETQCYLSGPINPDHYERRVARDRDPRNVRGDGGGGEPARIGRAEDSPRAEYRRLAPSRT